MDVLITGGAGYIGKYLARELAQKNDIGLIFAIDKKPKPDDLALGEKIKYFQRDLSIDGWEKILPQKPDIVIHSAFDIRSYYGKIGEQERNNIESSRRVFEYCFKNSVKQLIYFSSAAIFGPKPENIDRLLKEDEIMGENEYPYGMQKKAVEEMLEKMARDNGALQTKTIILRFSTVNGPEGEKRRKFGMLSMIKKIFPILPCGGLHWARQYLHEKDILSCMQFLISRNNSQKFEIFNLTPNDFLEMKDMAKLLNKRMIVLPLWFVKISFFLAWHLSLGFFPTCRGSWKSFAYPSNMDGNKISRLGFCYKYNSTDAFFGKI